MVYRNSPPMTVNITGRKGQKLDILVENMGRINYGAEINENQKVTFIIIVGSTNINIYMK